MQAKIGDWKKMYKEKSSFNKNKVSELNLSASLHLLPGTDAGIKYAR